MNTDEILDYIDGRVEELKILIEAGISSKSHTAFMEYRYKYQARLNELKLLLSVIRANEEE